VDQAPRQRRDLGEPLEYLDSPGQLEVILRGLDQVRKAAY
jgi:hypothetical protein